MTKKNGNNGIKSQNKAELHHLYKGELNFTLTKTSNPA